MQQTIVLDNNIEGLVEIIVSRGQTWGSPLIIGYLRNCTNVSDIFLADLVPHLIKRTG
ncbi:MAG: hypothetical protein ABIL69_00590 [candidate division WOR-3 bacterium]